MTPAEGEAIARAWVEAFNAHDLERLVALYADDCTHTSPKLRAAHPETGGKLLGKPALTEWFRDALKRLPDLRYELKAVTANGERVFIEYVRFVGTDAPLPVAEVFDVRARRIAASRVYHG